MDASNSQTCLWNAKDTTSHHCCSSPSSKEFLDFCLQVSHLSLRRRHRDDAHVREEALGRGPGRLDRAVRQGRPRDVRDFRTVSTNLLMTITLFALGQSYKGFTIVNYVSRVIPGYEIAFITTLDS